MSEKRFKLIKPLGTRLGLKDIFIKDTQEDYYYNTKETVVDLLNRLSEENEQLKEERDALQKKTEMDKNDFFISEAKRMTLLAFIEEKALQKEYSEWERRIWDE